jgi:hypothetical protein
MNNTYYLNLATLLKTLANISAILMAELPDGVPGYDEPCKGYIRVHNNAIIMSVIMNDGRIIAEGLQALQLLENNKKWHVSFSPDLLDNPEQQKLLPPPSQPFQNSDTIPPQFSGKANRRSFSIPVQQSPTTGPLPRQQGPSTDPNISPATGPLPPQSHFSNMGQLYTPSPTQSEIPAVARQFIPDGKVFQQQTPLSSQLIERYNAKERLILRTVYAKINGQRRVDQLKEELRLPVATVERDLSELYRLGMIE